ncbi:bone marrow proteoglycan-like [Empidonax traillii]|uniref:bone marrow proteoglycan-like n=1 Tax=Empidonax traillii TaxID=164674 RepID=UPI000FFD285F|nr:bone marrow proteoglycan-like [Empidonax traillii]
MWPCLLLALALLGTVPTSHPTPPQPQGLPAAEAIPQRYYAVVKRLRTYSGAQSGGAGRCQQAQVRTGVRRHGWERWVPGCACPQAYCQDVYRGQLASLHSAARNQELQKLARTYTYFAVWIGAVTSRKTGKWESCWEDSSPWNYANWAPTHPCHIVTTCTTLSTRDGLWRSRPCFELRPFICQY